MLPSSGVPVSPFTGVPGWETVDEEAVLRDLAKAIPAGGWIVELGAEYGRSAAAFASTARPDVKIASIDLFPPDHPLVGRLIDAYKANLTEAGFARRTLAYQMDSAEAGRTWPHGEIDLLFIDGDHTYQAVLGDIRVWQPRLKRRCYVAFHDCAHGDLVHDLHREVSRAVEAWFDPAAWEELGQVDSLRVFRMLASERRTG